jgi:beta-lactam-binding protein with PASTA domain
LTVENGRYNSADEMRSDLLRYLQGATPVAAGAAAAAAATALINAPPPTVPPDETARVVAQQYQTPPPDNRNQATYFAAVFGLLALLAVGVFILFQLLQGGEPVTDTVEIPDLVGEPAEQAFEALQQLDLKVRSREEHNQDVEAGLVISTEPPAGTEVAQESFVTVVVSAGLEQFLVPNVVDDNEQQARARIEAQGFTVGIVDYQLTEDTVEGTVLFQSPAGGTTAAPGAPVDLVVSSGPFSIIVADVTNMTLEQAIATLTREGFENITSELEYSLDVLEGRVIRTEPEAGASVPRGSLITIFESQGPEPVDVPNLVGRTEGEARALLNDIGLLLVVSTETIDVALDSGLIGKVAEQSPASGITVDVGSEVVVKLGVLRTVPVPDFSGLTLAEAQTAGTNAGLIVEQAGDLGTAAPGEIDRVLDQTPAAGTEAEEGSIVAVFIGIPIVPDFTGMTLVDAQAAGAALTLSVQQSSATTECGAVQPGRVVSQNPAPSVAVQTGTVVNVAVCIGE